MVVDHDDDLLIRERTQKSDGRSTLKETTMFHPLRQHLPSTDQVDTFENTQWSEVNRCLPTHTFSVRSRKQDPEEMNSEQMNRTGSVIMMIIVMSSMALSASCDYRSARPSKDVRTTCCTI